MMATTMTEQRDYPMLIGGEWVTTKDTRTIRLPYDGAPVAEVYDADSVTVERAVVSAQRGTKTMASL